MEIFRIFYQGYEFFLKEWMKTIQVLLSLGG